MKRFPMSPFNGIAAALGLVVGMLVFLNTGFRDAPNSVPQPVRSDGDIVVMGESSKGAPEDTLGPRALAFGRVAQSDLAAGLVFESIAALKRIPEADHRDIAIQWTVGKLLQDDSAPSMDRITKLQSLADEFKDKTLQSSLYARLGEMRAKLKGDAKQSPTVAELLNKSQTIAESIPPDPVERRHPLRWLWSVLSSAGYGLLVFLGSTLVGSALGESGKAIAAGLIEAGKHGSGSPNPVTTVLHDPKTQSESEARRA